MEIGSTEIHSLCFTHTHILTCYLSLSHTHTRTHTQRRVFFCLVKMKTRKKERKGQENKFDRSFLFGNLLLFYTNLQEQKTVEAVVDWLT